MIKGRGSEAELLKEIAVLEQAKTKYVVRFLGYSVCPSGKGKLRESKIEEMPRAHLSLSCVRQSEGCFRLSHARMEIVSQATFAPEQSQASPSSFETEDCRSSWNSQFAPTSIHASAFDDDSRCNCTTSHFSWSKCLHGKSTCCCIPRCCSVPVNY